MALPSFTKTIDDYFTSTWYEIRAEAIDNILDATVVWAALKDKGCLKTQVGGLDITRTIRYGEATTLAVAKGDIFSQGEPALRTAARWAWRYLSAHVQRSVIDDQQNSGKFRLASLVAGRTTAAKEALEQAYETAIQAAEVTAETGKEIQGLNAMIPLYSNCSTGTYGGISKPTDYVDQGNGVYKPTAGAGNTWWGTNYLQLTVPYEVNLVTNMKTLYNSVHNNQIPPDLILCSQTLFETYEDFALDASQIIKDEKTRLADLGFEVLRFKGKPMIWSPNTYDSVNSKEEMLFLNTQFIDVVYDPNLWFDMTEWKNIPLQGERIAHILCAMNIVSSQLRRHGRLTEATVS